MIDVKQLTQPQPCQYDSYNKYLDDPQWVKDVRDFYFESHSSLKVRKVMNDWVWFGIHHFGIKQATIVSSVTQAGNCKITATQLSEFINPEQYRAIKDNLFGEIVQAILLQISEEQRNEFFAFYTVLLMEFQANFQQQQNNEPG